MRKPISEGQAVKWFSRSYGVSNALIENQGVVVESDETGMHIVDVDVLDSYISCNDSNDTSEAAQHHVRLRDCPPPFSELCSISKLGCYANTEEGHVTSLSYADFRHCGGKLIEPESKVSSRDLRNIGNTMMTDNQLQKELGLGRGHEFGF